MTETAQLGVAARGTPLENLNTGSRSRKNLETQCAGIRHPGDDMDQADCGMGRQTGTWLCCNLGRPGSLSSLEYRISKFSPSLKALKLSGSTSCRHTPGHGRV